MVKINMLGLGDDKNIRSYSSKENIWIEYKKREFKKVNLGWVSTNRHQEGVEPDGNRSVQR